MKEKKEKDLFRIGELIKKTGISRETIHFYMMQGLLPEPMKTSKNMSWYNQSHLDRLKLIQDLKEKQFLPLKAIKAIVNGESGNQFTEQQKKLLDNLKENVLEKKETESLINFNEFIKNKKVDDSDLLEFKKSKIISLQKVAGFDYISKDDSLLVEKWLSIKENIPLSFKDIEKLKESIDSIFEEDKKLINKLEKVKTENMENAIDNLSDITKIFHKKNLNRFIKK